MRPVTIALLLLLAWLQYPLWFGHGGRLRIHELKLELAAQQKIDDVAQLRNTRLQGEVRDLTSGTAAVEERARNEMSLVKADEVFVQIVPPITR